MMFINRNEKYYEWLPAYLEGDLSEEQLAQMQKRLNADFALALEAERQRRALESLRQWAALGNPPTNAVVPNDLWARLATRLEPEPVTQSVRQIRWTAGLGVAAVVTLAAAIWLPIKPAPHSTKGVKVAATIPPAPSVKPLNTIAVPPSATPPLNVTITPSALPPNLSQGVALPTTVVTAKLPPASSISPVLLAHPSTVAQNYANPTTKPVQMADRRISPLLEGKSSTLDESVPVFKNAPQSDTPSAGGFAVGGALSEDSSKFYNLKTANRPSPDKAESAVGKVSADRFAMREKDMLTLEAPKAPAILAPAAAEPAPFASSAMVKSRRMTDGLGGSDQSPNHWQQALSSSVQSPLWGNDSGADQTKQALIAASKAGQLNILRDHLEDQCAQSPEDIGAGRMLAALYEFSGKNDLSLQQRRRLSGLATTTGEDWFALAQAEERAGNTQASKAAYRHALESPVPPSPSHAARARQRE